MVFAFADEGLGLVDSLLRFVSSGSDGFLAGFLGFFSGVFDGIGGIAGEIFGGVNNATGCFFGFRNRFFDGRFFFAANHDERGGGEEGEDLDFFHGLFGV